LEKAIPEKSALARELWIASTGILLLMGIVKHANPNLRILPGVEINAFTIVAAAQLFVPIYLIGRRGITKETLGLRLDRWKEDLLLLFALSVIVTVPFAIGHHYWQTILYHRPFRFRMPDDLLNTVVTEVLVVALAEELYFRGYLQERFSRLWPAKRMLFGAPFGKAIIVSAAIFALAHFVGEYRPDRLGPFFPALVFGLLRARTGTIVAAVGFHAYCNVLGEVLWASYRPL
jgi:membrane protease YdiL (CAAX protease family)